MFVYLLCLVLGLVSIPIQADQQMPDAEQSKRHMADTAIENINKICHEVFDAILAELDETHRMHAQLQSSFMSLEREAEELRAIKAESAMTQRDLQRALEEEASTKQKLVRVHQHANKELSQIKGEFEAFKTRLETTTQDFDKVFW